MELQVLDQNVIVQAFATQGGTDALFERIAEQARSFVPDVTTRKGREEIGSVAMKVSKSKTLTEKYAKDLVSEEKARIKLIDDDRIQFCKKMDSLRDEILAPRDAWEQAEKDRVAKCLEFLDEITELAKPEFLGNAAWQLKGYIDTLSDLKIDSRFMEFEEQAKIAKYETLEVLRTALTNREKYEAEQAELERLRQAEQVRIQQERDAQIAREATEKAQREAEEKARFEVERFEREKLEAEQRNQQQQREADQREAQLKLQKEQAELREAQLKQKAIDDAKQAEIDKQNAIEAERLRIESEQKAQAEAAEKAEIARQENKKLRDKVLLESVESLMNETGIDEDQAKKVIKAIFEKKVLNISIKF